MKEMLWCACFQGSKVFDQLELLASDVIYIKPVEELVCVESVEEDEG